MFVGWDWASTTHDVTVLDNAGAVVDHWAPAHTEAGLADTLTRLARHGQPDQLPVAIEQSSGLVVDRLLAAGHPVVPVHATAFHAARPRWGAAGAKSDPGDSYRLAEDLRTDGHRLRRRQPLDRAVARSVGHPIAIMSPESPPSTEISLGARTGSTLTPSNRRLPCDATAASLLHLAARAGLPEPVQAPRRRPVDADLSHR